MFVWYWKRWATNTYGVKVTLATLPQVEGAIEPSESSMMVPPYNYDCEDPYRR